MANAKHDENNRPTIIGISSADQSTIDVIQANPTNHALKVNNGTYTSSLISEYKLDSITGATVTDSTGYNNATLKVNAGAYYPFNGDANDTSVDYSLNANNRNGTVSGATLVADRFGNANSAYSFPGNTSNNKIDLPIASLSHTGYISLWISPKGDGTPDVGGTITVFNSQLNTRHRLFYSNGTNPTICFVIGSNSATSTTFSMTIGNWYHVVCSWNQSNKAKFFVNGVQIGSDLTYTDITTNPNSFTLGSFNSASPNPGSFNGYIDEVIVGNVYPSASDVLRLYNVGLVHKLNSPVVSGGKISNCFDLWGIGAGTNNSSGSIVDCGTGVSNILKNQSTFTIAYWNYYTTSNGFYNTVGWYGGNYKGPYILLASNGQISAVIGQGNTTGSYNNYNLNTTAVAVPNSWNHIALTYDGSNVTIYLNGASIMSYNIGAFVDNGSGGQRFKINGNPWDTYNTGASKYDDVRVYSTALTASQIYDLYTLNDRTNAKIDENSVSTLLALSSVDGQTLVPLYTDGSGKLLIQSA